jgi:phytol kinase
MTRLPLTAAPSLSVTTAPARPGVGRLSQTEVKRRLLHMLPGFLPFCLWPIPHQDPWGPVLSIAVLLLAVSIIAPAIRQFHRVARAGERDGHIKVLSYGLPIMLALWLFRGREEIGVMTLAILAFGDGSATLGGLLFGRRGLPWNPRKSWTGSLCFVICGTVMASLVYWGEARPAVEITQVLLVTGGATLAAAIAESLPVRINDNLRVGVTAAVMGAVLSVLVVG